MALSIDEFFAITCGPCGRSAPVARWCQTVAGPLPQGEYQCPGCGWSFKRAANPNSQPWEKYIQLVPFQTHL